MSEIVVPNEMAKRLGVTPLRFRNWLRAGHAAGHPLLAGHVHGSRWEFTRPDAERLIAEFQSVRGRHTDPGARNPSSSDVQSRAESVIRTRLARRLECELRPRTIPLGDGASVQVDAVAHDTSVIAEIFARQGALRPGQQKKVAIDTLKLITIRDKYPDAELILAFADRTAAAYAKGRGWLAHALRVWNVRVEVVDIPSELRDEIQTAQARQRMVNADDIADDIALDLGV